MDYKKRTVKDLRVIAKDLGVKPIPRRKSQIIREIESAEKAVKAIPKGKTKATSKGKTKAIPKGKAKQSGSTEKKPLPRCSGEGITKIKLRNELSELGLLAGYQLNGAFLSFKELQTICMAYREEPPKESNGNIDEEKILKENEYALLIKKEDPGLYDTVKGVVTFIPNPRDLLVVPETFQHPDVPWKPWRELYDEINTLFQVIGEETSPGSRPELKEILDYLQENGKEPARTSIVLFEGLFPILSYVYTQTNIGFRWLLVRADLSSPFLLSRLRPEENRQARIPYLLRPVEIRIHRFYKHTLGSGDIEHDNVNDMNRLLHYAHRLDIFKYVEEEEELKKYIRINEVVYRKKKNLGFHSIFLVYLNHIRPDTHPEWMDVALYIFRNYDFSSKEIYRYLYKFAETIIDNGFQFRDDVRELMDEVPPPTRSEDRSDLFGDQRTVRLGYAILFGRSDIVRPLLQKILKDAPRSFPVSRILGVALKMHDYDIIGDILDSQVLEEKEYYTQLIRYLDDDILSFLEKKKFEMNIDRILEHTAGSFGIGKKGLDGLEFLLERRVDPANPPFVIQTAFKTLKGEINHMIEFHHSSGPPSGWSHENHIRFLSLMIDYGAIVLPDYLRAIMKTLTQPYMEPIMKKLIDLGVVFALDFFFDSDLLEYASSHMEFTDKERIELLKNLRFSEVNMGWIENEIERNPLMTPEVAGEVLAADNFAILKYKNLVELLKTKKPIIPLRGITRLIISGMPRLIANVSDYFDISQLLFPRPSLNVFSPASKSLASMKDFPEEVGLLTTMVALTKRTPGDDYYYSDLLNTLSDLLDRGYRPGSGFLFYLFRLYASGTISLKKGRIRMTPKTREVETIQKALKSGADVNQALNKTTPLKFLLSLPVVKTRGKGLDEERLMAFLEILLKNGADLNDTANGTTALIDAVKKKNATIVKYLREEGADLEILDKKGKKAIDYATESKDKSLLALL